MSTKKEFLTETVPTLLKDLKEDQEAQFGLMTAQHMIEHLTSIIKSSVKRYGEPDPALAERQSGFKRYKSYDRQAYATGTADRTGCACLSIYAPEG